jgi:hypothetical protein
MAINPMAMNGIETFRELKPNKVVSQLVTMISDRLSFFPSSKEFIEVLIKKKNENQHSTAFCLFMTNDCKSKFYFNRENAQIGSSTVDIGVYVGANLVFVIEAKLLPTPPSENKQKPRYEYEYVYGKGAAIQLFKDMQHGVDNADVPFSDSGIIAFIKGNDFVFWFEKINQWIFDAKWDASEQLQKVNINSTATFLSAHVRTDETKIRLHHFWVYV